MAAKNEKLEKMFSELEKGVLSVYTSKGYLDYLSFMSKFRSYSARNQMLIFIQNNKATLCAGYNTWKKQGRQVLAGEKAITIIGGSSRAIWIEEKDEITGEMRKIKKSIMRYFPVSVFDISQTEGEELPHPSIEPIADFKGYEKIKESLLQISPVPVSFERIESEADGFYSPDFRKIVISDNLSQAKSLQTLIHEIAHAKFEHSYDKGKERGHMEVEAESVAYLVCDFLGLDISDCSFPYIATWAKDKEASELLESQEIILNLANEIIEALKPQKDKEAA